MTPDTSNREEAAAVEQALQGDPSGFEWIVRKHYDRLWRAVWRIVRHDQQAEDVVQEVFLAAHAALPISQSKAPLATWLLEIAVGQASALESTRRGALPRQRQHFASPRTEETIGLERCLATLDRSLRVPLSLRLQGIRYEEIAQVLHLPVATVRSRLFLARDALSKCIRRKTTAHG